MLLVLLISLLVLYTPVAPHQAPWAWTWTVAGVAALAAANALAWWVGAGAVSRAGRDDAGLRRLRAGRMLVMLKLSILGFVLLDVFALRWPQMVQHTLGRFRWMVLVDDAVLVFPVVVMMLTGVAVWYRYERAARRVALSLRQYVWLRFRLEMAILLVPWLLLATVSDLSYGLFCRSGYAHVADLVSTLLVLVAVVVLGPLLLRYLWGCSPMPAGALRRRLEEFSRVQRFRCRDILVWHTHNHLPNAGIIGLVPGLRYVMISDALLLRCTDDEVEAVLAHEVGHVRGRHLAFYVTFAVGFLCFYANLVDLLAGIGWVEPLRNVLVFEATTSQAVVMLAFACFYWVFLFGAISRRLECQADLFSVRATGRPEAFISALEKLAASGHTHRRAGSWRHFSVERRVEFLRSAVARPAKAARYSLWVWTMQAAVQVLLALGLVRLVVWRSDLFGM